MDIHAAFELSLMVEASKHGSKGYSYKSYTNKNPKLAPFIPKEEFSIPSATKKTTTPVPVFKRLSHASIMILY